MKTLKICLGILCLLSFRTVGLPQSIGAPFFMAIQDLKGKSFGRLTVIEFSGTKLRRSQWVCKCECGNTSIVYSTSLLTGKTRSCGCLRNEAVANNRITHGHSVRVTGVFGRSKEYILWCNMKARCYNKKNLSFKHYGARGIKMCDRWLESFENFLSDMGKAPSLEHSLDRKNNNKGYSKSNCRWATTKEQSNNKSTSFIIKYQGEKKTLSEWCTQLNLQYDRTRDRIVLLKWTVERAFTTPKLKSRYDKSENYV